MTWREEEGRGKEEGRMAVKINIKIYKQTYGGNNSGNNKKRRM